MNLQHIVQQFTNAGSPSVEPLGAGHINTSYLVTNGSKKYVLQRVNHDIFKNIPQLQNNILRVTQHIRQKLAEQGVTDTDRKVLNLLPSNDGKWFYQSEDGSYWRMMDYVTNSYSYESVTPQLAEKAGEAFGNFQHLLADLPNGPLFEIIPNFHNMESRLADFRQAVQRNVAKRLSEVLYLVDEIEKRADEMCLPERLYREGKLPKRVNHCDTKVNNVLFDVDGNVLCVVDLDTVMPGFVLSDFGDFMRTGANNGTEDDTNLNRVSLNLPVFEAYAKGYLKKANAFLTDVERSYLAFGAKLLTYMQTVRFLADYLNGDTYYKTHHPKHNLERAQAQFKLLQSMEENFDTMQQIVQNACGKQ